MILQGFRLDVERPIGAILALNTVASAAGAAPAGAGVVKIFGSEWLVWFSVGFTAVILVFSEILPRSIGVLHGRVLIYGSDLDDVQGIVYRRELLSAAAHDLHALRLKDLAHPLVSSAIARPWTMP